MNFFSSLGVIYVKNIFGICGFFKECCVKMVGEGGLFKVLKWIVVGWVILIGRNYDC